MSMLSLEATGLPRQAADLLERVRTRAPRVHSIMNMVVPKLVADGLSALGGIPSMTSSPEEIQSFVRKADALVINLGTLDTQRRSAIDLAVQAAAEAGMPWLLDPAHCDYSPPRAAFAQTLLARGATVLRTNAAEYDLLDVPAGTVRVRTGKVDRIAFSGCALLVENGHPLMAEVAGTGCLSGAVIAAFMAVEQDRLAATVSAMLVIGIAAEIAAGEAKGPGSFEPALLDALFNLSPDDITQNARVRDDQG